jgi:hypothetical protein
MAEQENEHMKIWRDYIDQILRISYSGIFKAADSAILIKKTSNSRESRNN